MRELRLAPVIVIEDPEDAVPLAGALVEGGLPCAEITFRTAGAAEALRRIAGEYPDLLLGAGTVLTREQAAEARSAGVRFIVTPGFNPAVVDYCLEHEVPIYPGVCTPTEIEAALSQGLNVLKFFPAEPMGGLPFLTAISGPYGMVEFIPTGGINPENLGTYLAFQKVVACGGSWLAPPKWIQAKEFERIRQEVEAAVRIVRNATKGED
ncbi:MAG: bifunctional 4-hydroxy-2-oxoglutarate aldolase/2-dehydro-3-deoxy-phosphogluconate aldolase [Gemmatimonadetes bacterium]|nr:bifunctional 4-hydroxy-2-oxoglutarate aldolase/2-dehydro-3-deoxy-phosphogluconate aldolase [Gemmatimonadota bacterium]